LVGDLLDCDIDEEGMVVEDREVDGKKFLEQDFCIFLYILG
jgi:hypothetical protein